MNKSNPWEDLPKSGRQGYFSTLKVGEELNPLRIDVRWAISSDGRRALLIGYKLGKWHSACLPEFENMELYDSEEDQSLALVLNDKNMLDMFFDICTDVIACLQEVPDAQRREATILRLERWSLLLKPTRNRMSEEQQKGLIAELLFLKDDVLKELDEASALQAWTGPLRDSRDFSFGNTFVEVKSKRNSSTTNISISSENQLNTSESEELFLYVVDIDRAPQDQGFCVADIANETRNAIESPIQRTILDSKLASVGYFDEDDYSATRWSHGVEYYYAVLDGFPRIDSKLCPPGVSRVSYHIDLDYCENFRVDRIQIVKSTE